MSRFIDEVNIEVQSGHGGRGAVSFRREKYVPRGGPDGGDGGDGGNIVFRVKREMRSLYPLYLKRRYKAEDGRPGSGKNKKGPRGGDCVILIPPGSVIIDRKSGAVLADLTENGSEAVLLRGGRGGLGNAQFATSTNRAPRYAQKGLSGASLSLALEIKTIADVGIVGLPNAGKSTLLKVLTDARPKIGDYPFTTLHPNLGVLTYRGERQFVIADLPGLIEGAHQGHGLGVKFLRHIERTKALLLLLDLSAGELMKQYDTLLHELDMYCKSASGKSALINKARLVAGSKRDIVSGSEEDELNRMEIPERKICISSVTRLGIDALKEEIALLMEKVDANAVQEARNIRRDLQSDPHRPSQAG